MIAAALSLVPVGILPARFAVGVATDFLADAAEAVERVAVEILAAAVARLAEAAAAPAIHVRLRTIGDAVIARSVEAELGGVVPGLDQHAVETLAVAILAAPAVSRAAGDTRSAAVNAHFSVAEVRVAVVAERRLLLGPHASTLVALAAAVVVELARLSLPAGGAVGAETAVHPHLFAILHAVVAVRWHADTGEITGRIDARRVQPAVHGRAVACRIAGVEVRARRAARATAAHLPRHRPIREEQRVLIEARLRLFDSVPVTPAAAAEAGGINESPERHSQGNPRPMLPHPHHGHHSHPPSPPWPFPHRTDEVPQGKQSANLANYYPRETLFLFVSRNQKLLLNHSS